MASHIGCKNILDVRTCFLTNHKEKTKMDIKVQIQLNYRDG